jgi:hypothetical protein
MLSDYAFKNMHVMGTNNPNTEGRKSSFIV